MMQDKDLTDDVLDEIIAGAKTSLEQYLALSLKAERAANRQQNEPQNIPEIIPGGLVEAVNNLLNNDGSRGRYSAIGCGEAREKIELWLAQRQKWESQRSENLCAGNSPVIPDGWVACSERMPEKGRTLVLFGKRIKEVCANYVDEGYIGDDGEFYFFDWEGGPRIDDCHPYDKAIVTHWMYWELPAAPKQEV
ncbi:DUF551 domain-containing protein [Enterobacter hormaechei]